jgi:geranylgeranyl pyrophosphate synthase
MSSNITIMKNQIDSYFHNTYLAKYPIDIHDMLIYLFSNGKRIRPILFIAFNHIASLEEFSQNHNATSSISINWIDYAIEIELIHCLSLVIDDLPDMDNDTERRGKPCFHIKYGLQKTNFFIYYLFSKVSSNLSNLIKFHKHKDKSTNNTVSHKIIDDASYIINFLINNLIDGQYIDITSSSVMKSNLQKVVDSNINMVVQLIISIYSGDTTIPTSAIHNYIILNIKKTGSLFALPIITGFLFQIYKKNLEYTGDEIIQDEFNLATSIENMDNSRDTDTNANANANTNAKKINLEDDNILNLIMTWAMMLGFLFQTSDDFLDMIPDSTNGKPNICNILGAESSIRLLSKCTLVIRVMFDYIYKNTRQIWPDITIDSENVYHILDVIEARFTAS